MSEPAPDPSDRSMAWLYAGALLVEAVVLVVLWLVGRFFG